MKSKMITSVNVICWLLLSIGCSKKSGSTAPQSNNHAPLASLVTSITNVNPFTAEFKVTASDADNDALTYKWDFGEGTTKDGAATETFAYTDSKTYTVKVAVSDGKAPAVNLTASINTNVTTVTIDESQKFQIMEGFGGFGAKDVYWSSGPFTSPDFVNSLINDLGITILRDNIPTDFEDVNDDSDPHTTDLSKFKLNSLNNRLQYLKDMKAAGLQKLIVTIWSAPTWMKTNNRIDNGTTTNAAPAYNPNPTSADNQLRTDMYDEFAERCVAYIKIIKQQTGIDVYALSLANEPRFSQSYESCVFNGEALAALIKVVGKRFNDEGITTKIFMPEDVGYFDGINGLIQPILNDAEAMSYVGIVATHGYAFDGITAASTDAQTWQAMYNWGAASGKPLWMTETSGFTNDMKGAMDLSKAMYTAITYGNVAAWVFWTLSTGTLDGYSLMSSAGEKSKRYYSSKNFYSYVRPGAQRISAATNEESKIYALAFKNAADASTAVVIINDNTEARTIKLSGTGLSPQFTQFNTSATDNCKDAGTVNSSNAVLLQANSITTLYGSN